MGGWGSNGTSCAHAITRQSRLDRRVRSCLERSPVIASGIDDKDLGGKVGQGVGNVTDNPEVQMNGEADELRGKARQGRSAAARAFLIQQRREDLRREKLSVTDA